MPATLERAMGTVGFAEAVADLRARGGDLVRVGGVEIEDPPYQFQLYLNEHASAVVACLGVDQSRSPHGPAGTPPRQEELSVHSRQETQLPPAAPLQHRPPTLPLGQQSPIAYGKST